MPRTVTLFPDDLSVALRSERITTIFVTTDLFNQLVRARPDVFRTVEDVLVGGFAIDVKWIAACLRNGPPRRLLHVYGPTESTAFASWHFIDQVAEGARLIPIGSPLANTQLYVLDRYMSPVPAHCRSVKQAGFTPSDFAQAGISQNNLDKLVAAVDKRERTSG